MYDTYHKNLQFLHDFFTFLQLLIGNYGLTIDQSKTQMAIWAILAAPLLMSTDLKNIRPEFREILNNQAVIDVNQDKLGIQGTRLRVERKIEVYKRKRHFKQTSQ